MSLDVVTVGAVCADVMVRPVDSLPNRGALKLVNSIEMRLGGLAGVTAIVTSQLGASSGFIGRLGEDSFGKFLLQTLEREGVDTSLITRDSAHQTSATAVLVAEDGERSFLHHIGTNGEISEHDIPIEALRAKVLHWGGPGITPKLEGAPMGRVYAAARKAGITTSMDTCYDGQGIWLPLIEPSLPHLDLLFTSLEEARLYSGQEEPPEIVNFFQCYGVETVVVKLGAEGIYARRGEETVQVQAHEVEVVDTTGAGDAACAGFLYGHVRGWSLEQCARLANAVGGLTVTKVGGAEAVQSLEQVQQFMEQHPCLNSALSQY